MAKSSPLTPELYAEILKVAQTSPAHKLIHGKAYLYFALTPTQENITVHEVAKKTPYVHCLAVKNFKKVTIGYLVLLSKKPKHLALHEYGAAIYHSKIPPGKEPDMSYAKLELVYSDAKFRILAFDKTDSFISVKWKSSNPEA
jgi:hypothetical protein